MLQPYAPVLCSGELWQKCLTDPQSMGRMQKQHASWTHRDQIETERRSASSTCQSSEPQEVESSPGSLVAPGVSRLAVLPVPEIMLCHLF